MQTNVSWKRRITSELIEDGLEFQFSSRLISSRVENYISDRASHLHDIIYDENTLMFFHTVPRFVVALFAADVKKMT